MTALLNENCAPLDVKSEPISETDIKEFLPQIPDWQITSVDGIPRLKRTFKFSNFLGALKFTNTVGELAEEQGHHPLITLTWGQATVEWWTHDIGGLHLNDFIMAAKTDILYR